MTKYIIYSMNLKKFLGVFFFQSSIFKSVSIINVYSIATLIDGIICIYSMEQNLFLSLTYETSSSYLIGNNEIHERI